jgi:hypothetical protein
LLAPTSPGQAPARSAPDSSEQPAATQPRPVYRPEPSSYSYTDDPYDRSFDVGSLSPETAAAYRQHRFHATFSVLLLILVHFLTLGLASPFLIARKYTFLPKLRSSDFSTGKAAGFLLIPFFSLYWVFVLCRRLVDRLTLQARLWNLPGAPSRALATTVAISWVASGIPYIGLLVLAPLYLVLWPIYLGQVQGVCNRLALAAAPVEVRPSMPRLEQATRSRWLGWIVLAPALVMLATVLTAGAVAPSRPVTETISVAVVLLVIAGGGGALVYLGVRGGHELQDELARTAPWILAAYLRIDKNAAWTVAWIAIPLASAFVVAGLVALVTPTSDAALSEAWPSIVLGVMIGVGGSYTVLRALQLKRRIAWLEAAGPASDGPGPAAW